MIAIDLPDLPQLVKLTRHRPGCANGNRLRRAGTIHRPDDLAVGRQAVAVGRGIAHRGDLRHPAIPCTGNFGPVGIIRAVITKTGGKCRNAGSGIAQQRHRAMFDKIMRLHIQRDHLALD